MGENETPSDVIELERVVREYVPGIGILAIGAAGAWLLAPSVPALNPLLLAILIGVLLANVVGLPSWADDGVASHRVFLGAAIVLMGASLSVDMLARGGLLVPLFVVGSILFTLTFVEVISRTLLDVDAQLSSLLAAGSGICGVSAVVAVAASIRARDDHIVYATATILLFDALTLVAYPAVGDLLDIPAQTFGIWSGISMFSTGPVIAVGFTHSEAAGQWATLTKLTRNAFIGVVAVGYAAYYARNRTDTADGKSDLRAQLRTLWHQFPSFVVGFVALMLLASAGVFSQDQLLAIEHAYNWLFLLAFVGVGAELSVMEFRHAGATPVLVVFATLCTVSVLSLATLSFVLG